MEPSLTVCVQTTFPSWWERTLWTGGSWRCSWSFSPPSSSPRYNSGTARSLVATATLVVALSVSENIIRNKYLWIILLFSRLLHLLSSLLLGTNSSLLEETEVRCEHLVTGLAKHTNNIEVRENFSLHIHQTPNMFIDPEASPGWTDGESVSDPPTNLSPMWQL